MPYMPQDSEKNPDIQHLLEQAQQQGDDASVQMLLDAYHPSDIADALEAMPRELRVQLWQNIEADKKGEILTEVHGEVREQLINSSSEKELVDALAGLQPDELADIDEKLPDSVVDKMLAGMDATQKFRYESVRRYPDDTAGGLMDIDAVTISPDDTLLNVLNEIRELRKREGAVPEHLESVMVVDAQNYYLGALRLSDAVSLSPKSRVGDVMDTGVPAIEVMTPANKVAQLFENLDLISAPVVNEVGQLLGRITVDDVIDVIRGQSEHTIMSQAGLNRDMDMFAPLMQSAFRRNVWLSANLVNAFIAAYVIDLFSASIQQIVALAVLMPVIASMGGVAGNQSLALVTRGLALDQVKSSNARRLLLRETALGMINGLFWASVVTLVIIYWFDNLSLGLVFAVALIINLLTAALAGTLVPLVLNKAGIDPALAGGVLLMAVTDVVGFSAFLGLATLILL